MRRRSNPRPDIEADEVEKFFAELPRVIPELERGRRLNRRLILFIIGAALVCGLALDHVLDRITAAARLDRQRAFEQCQLINDNARHFDGLIDKVVLRVRTSNLSAADKAQAIALYESSKQSLPVCNRP